MATVLIVIGSFIVGTLFTSAFSNDGFTAIFGGLGIALIVWGILI